MAGIETLDILIVDDHEPMRAMLRKVLERAGVAHIREAARGDDALALLKRRGADLILVDQTMPGMDGLSLAAIVRAGATGAQTRIVLLTGRTDAAAREAARNAGVDAVLEKPIAPRDLLVALNDVLAR